MQRKKESVRSSLCVNFMDLRFSYYKTIIAYPNKFQTYKYHNPSAVRRGTMRKLFETAIMEVLYGPTRLLSLWEMSYTHEQGHERLEAASFSGMEKEESSIGCCVEKSLAVPNVSRSLQNTGSLRI